MVTAVTRSRLSLSPECVSGGCVCGGLLAGLFDRHDLPRVMARVKEMELAPLVGIEWSDGRVHRDPLIAPSLFCARDSGIHRGKVIVKLADGFCWRTA